MSARSRVAGPRTRRLAELGVLVTVVIWSANFVIVKAAIGELGPFTFTGARYLVASLTLLAILRLAAGLDPAAGRLRTALLSCSGCSGSACYQILWTTGLTQISAGDSALLVAASPVVVALLAAAVGMDRLDRAQARRGAHRVRRASPSSSAGRRRSRWGRRSSATR